jgi:hypothetical protein
MQELQILLNDRDIEFDAKDNRIGCYPHIINICVSHIVSSCTKGKAADYQLDTAGFDFSDDDDDAEEDNEEEDDEEEDDEEDVINPQQYDLVKWFESLKRDPVKRARAVVRTVRSSGQRKEDFLKLIRLGNNMKSFKDENDNVILLKELQLLKDVRHRWDSLYTMLVRLEEQRQVHLLSLPLFS